MFVHGPRKHNDESSGSEGEEEAGDLLQVNFGSLCNVNININTFLMNTNIYIY